jgi:hypothetical protein
VFQEIYAEILQVETNNKLVFPQFFPKTEKNKRGERVLFQIQFSKRKIENAFTDKIISSSVFGPSSQI